MHAMRRVGGARPARDKGNARTPGETCSSIRHHRRPRLLPADGDLDRGIMQRVKHGKVGLAGHAEDVLCPLCDELVDENLATSAGK